MSHKIVGNQRVSPDLIGDQFSLTAIPKMLYDFISSTFEVHEETIEKGGDYTTCYREIEIGADAIIFKPDKVFMLYSERVDGDSRDSKFALLSGEPSEFHYSQFHEFEIVGFPERRGWSAGPGYNLVEVLQWNTLHTRKLNVDQPMTKYVVLALAKAVELCISPLAISQSYIDHSASPR